MWAERNQRGIEGDPPCEDCRVELLDENDEAARVYQVVQSQTVTRFNGQHDEVIDLDFNAVKAIMDLYGVRDQRTCFEKVRRTFFHFLNEAREV